MEKIKAMYCDKTIFDINTTILELSLSLVQNKILYIFNKTKMQDQFWDPPYDVGYLVQKLDENNKNLKYMFKNLMILRKELLEMKKKEIYDKLELVIKTYGLIDILKKSKQESFKYHVSRIMKKYDVFPTFHEDQEYIKGIDEFIELLKK